VKSSISSLTLFWISLSGFTVLLLGDPRFDPDPGPELPESTRDLPLFKAYPDYLVVILRKEDPIFLTNDSSFTSFFYEFSTVIENS
jgi:hypothetical protein